MTFERFIRFLDEENTVQYGNLDSEMAAESIIGKSVKILHGHPLSGFIKTTESRTVMGVRSPSSLSTVSGVLREENVLASLPT